MDNFVIEIIPHKDDPSGLKTVNIIGRTLRAYVIPRVDISDVKEFENIDKPALYFLFRDNENDNSLYVGQTDNLLRRLSEQKIAKEDWNTALAFVAEEEMNVTYLEKKVINYIKENNRNELSNSTSSPGSQVTQSAKIVNDGFFNEIKFITTLLGYKIFIPKLKEHQAEKVYYLKSKGVIAKGTILVTNEFVVYKGSEASINESPAFSKYIKSSFNLRQKLIREGIIVRKKDKFIFKKDHLFSSPSGAADVVRGTATNGWTSWKDKSNKSLDENIRKK